ncbi:PDZ domain containing protein [Cyclospora cayetanensis]|uniref:PDZ domain containing protein n=1 Tax=Cyclospora cayetanensis TaxID=88456 RepID=A0A1D3D4Q9_9EIME|nr:PDZ domain containing protein [Cyclospora cayetanensis]
MAVSRPLPPRGATAGGLRVHLALLAFCWLLLTIFAGRTAAKYPFPAPRTPGRARTAGAILCRGGTTCPRAAFLLRVNTNAANKGSFPLPRLASRGKGAAGKCSGFGGCSRRAITRRGAAQHVATAAEDSATEGAASVPGTPSVSETPPVSTPPSNVVSPDPPQVASVSACAASRPEEWLAVVQLLHAPSHAVAAALVQETLQCLLWGSDSEIQVVYELITPNQEQLQRLEQQPGLKQALEEGAVQVHIFFEDRGVSSANLQRSSLEASSTRRERGLVLIRSLKDVAFAADLVIPAASRRSDGAAAVRMASQALEQQKLHQQGFPQQAVLLQRCRAALPLRRGILWSSLLCAEATAKLREKAGEDALPTAVQAVEAAPLLPLSWCTLGHALRLRGRLWESNCCYKTAESLAAGCAAAATPKSSPRAAIASIAAAAIPARLTEALERALRRAKLDPKELRGALPTLLQTTVEAPWGFAVDANPQELGGSYIAYVVEGSKADEAGLMQGDQIVIANDTSVLGAPFSKCLQALRTRQVIKPEQPQQQVQLLPLKLDVYRGALPLLYSAPGLAMLQRLDAVADMLGNEGEKANQKEALLTHVPAGSLRGILQGGSFGAPQLF